MNPIWRSKAAYFCRVLVHFVRRKAVSASVVLDFIKLVLKREL